MRRRCGNCRVWTDSGPRLPRASLGLPRAALDYPGPLSTAPASRLTLGDQPDTGGRCGSGPAIAREVHSRGPGCAFRRPAGRGRVPAEAEWVASASARSGIVGPAGAARSVRPSHACGPSVRRMRADRRTRADASDGHPALRGWGRAPARPVPRPPRVDMTCDPSVRRRGPDRAAPPGGARCRRIRCQEQRVPSPSAGVEKGVAGVHWPSRCGRRWLSLAVHNAGAGGSTRPRALC